MTQEKQTHSKASVSIAPAVLFAIGEIYQRRNDTSPSRIIGALFGTCQAASAPVHIQASQCFVVPHSEVADQISINSETYKQRSELHKKSYGAHSSIVGWFSITQDGAVLSEKNTAFINESFGREVAASGPSALSLHLNLHISANGSVERKVLVTDMSTKTVFSPESVQVSFSANDIFAARAVVEAVELHPEERVVTLEVEASFVARKISALKGKLAKLQEAQTKDGDVDAKTASDLVAALSAQLAKSKGRLEQDTAALRQVCESIKIQLHTLEELVVYQAHA